MSRRTTPASPTEALLESALTFTNEAGGLLVWMVTKRRLRESYLEDAKAKLRAALAKLEALG